MGPGADRRRAEIPGRARNLERRAPASPRASAPSLSPGRSPRRIGVRREAGSALAGLAIGRDGHGIERRRQVVHDVRFREARRAPVGRVEQATNRWGIGEDGADVLPVPLPHRDDDRVARAIGPRGERLERGGVGADRLEHHQPRRCVGMLAAHERRHLWQIEQILKARADAQARTAS